MRLQRFAAVVVACVIPALTARAQSARKSTTTGLFAGGSALGVSIYSAGEAGGTDTDTGPGAGVMVGYGFSPLLSLVADARAARPDAGDGSHYDVRQVDVGLRVHFLGETDRLRPYAEGLFGYRDARQQAIPDPYWGAQRLHRLTAHGTTLTAGGGLAVYASRWLAVDGGISYSVGSFGSYQLDGDPMPQAGSHGANGMTVHAGLSVWPVPRW